MKVLFISHEDSKFGAPRSLMELIYTLKNSYKVTPIVLLHSKDNVYFFCKKNNIECHVLGHWNISCGKKSIFSPIIKIIKTILNVTNDFFALRYIHRNIDMRCIDLIHSNVSIISLGWKLKKIYGIPHIVHLRESASNLDNHVYTMPVIPSLINGSDYFIAISNNNRLEWIKKGIPEDKIKLIYNGLKLDFDSVNHNYEEDKISILFLGSISHDKGQWQLVEALSLIPIKYRELISVDIIGKGHWLYKKKILSSVQKFGLLDTVKFLGYIDNKSIDYSKYNVGIMASKNEAFGRVTIEYLANKLCVIASNSGANPEIISNEQNGLLFDYGNVEALKDCLIKLIDNKSLKRKLSKQGFDSIKQFTTQHNAREVYSFYQLILRR